MKKTISFILCICMILSLLQLSITAQTSDTNLYKEEANLLSQRTLKIASPSYNQVSDKFVEQIEKTNAYISNTDTPEDLDHVNKGYSENPGNLDLYANGLYSKDVVSPEIYAAMSYYSGTNIPTFTYVTGRSLLNTLYSNDTIIYTYSYNLDDHFDYIYFLRDYCGWTPYKSTTADDGSYDLLTLVNLSTGATIGVAVMWDYYQTWILISPENMNSVSVTGVSLNKTSHEMTVGDTYTLTSTISPSNATNKNVSWSSSNTTVASVSSSGVVTAKKAGSATITVTTEDGKKTASCVIYVSAVSVSGVSLNKTSHEMAVGDTFTLTLTIAPSNATNKNVNWSSSNTTVASVSSSGVVTAKSAGTAKITVKTADGNKTATCTVTVTPKAISITNVTLNQTVATLVEGESLTLTATVAPANATNKKLHWSSSDTTVAIVENGVVTAQKPGTAIITVTTEDGNKTATCTITVEKKILTFSIGSATTTAGKTVSVDVIVSNNTGFAGAALQVEYDKSVMTLIAYESISLDATSNFDQDPTNNPVGFSWTRVKDYKADGVLLTLTFEIKDDAPNGQYDLTLSNKYNVANQNHEYVDFILVNGTISVVDSIPGDLNRDSTINAKDTVLLAQYIASWDIELDETSADCNGDGAVNSKDAVLLAQYLAGWDVTLG